MSITKREIVLALLTLGVGCATLRLAAWPRSERGEQHRYMACYSNIKQLGLALQQYSQDYDDTLPRPWFGHDAGPSDARLNYKWMDAVLPYAKDTALFNCPADGVSAPYRERDGLSYGSYVMNNAYSAPNDAQTPPAGLRLGEIVDSNTVLLLDGENNFQFSWLDASRTPPITSDDPFLWDSIRGRHGSGLYQTTATVGCNGASTGLLNYARATRIVGGRKIYPLLTIESD